MPSLKVSVLFTQTSRHLSRMVAVRVLWIMPGTSQGCIQQLFKDLGSMGISPRELIFKTAPTTATRSQWKNHLQTTETMKQCFPPLCFQMAIEIFVNSNAATNQLSKITPDQNYISARWRFKGWALATMGMIQTHSWTMEEYRGLRMLRGADLQLGDCV